VTPNAELTALVRSNERRDMNFQRKIFFGQMNGYNASQLLCILKELTVYTIRRVGYADTMKSIHIAFMSCFDKRR
jgi:hypothetical protein